MLNEINDMTTILSTPRSRRAFRVEPRSDKSNVLTINVNQNISKRIWNVPVTAGSETPLDESLPNSSNLTQPSNVTTLERITDLDFVEERLNSLKSQTETSL